MRKLFLALLLVAVASFFALIAPRTKTFKVLLVLEKEAAFLEYNNQAIEAIHFFERFGLSENVKVKVVFFESEEKFQKDLHFFKPDYIISVLHKPHAFEIVKALDGSVKMINAFPFSKIEGMINMSFSWQDVSRKLRDFVKDKGVSDILTGKEHSDREIEKYLIKALKGVKNSPDGFVLIVKRNPLSASKDIRRVLESGKGGKLIIITSHPEEYWDVYGDYLKDSYGIFPYYYKSSKRKDLLLKFKEMFGTYPDWTATSVIRSLLYISGSNEIGYDEAFFIGKFKDALEVKR